MEEKQKHKHHSRHHRRHHRYKQRYSNERQSYNKKEFQLMLMWVGGAVILMLLLIPLLANFFEQI